MLKRPHNRLRQGLPMREPQSITANEDERLIPVWSIVAAAAAFLLVEYYFWLVLPDGKHKMPLGLRIYFNLSWGLLASLYFLMVGRAARRHKALHKLAEVVGGDGAGAGALVDGVQLCISVSA